MPEYKPNPVARLAAVLALVAAVLVFIVLIATTGSDEGDNGGTERRTEQNGPLEGRRPGGTAGSLDRP